MYNEIKIIIIGYSLCEGYMLVKETHQRYLSYQTIRRHGGIETETAQGKARQVPYSTEWHRKQSPPDLNTKPMAIQVVTYITSIDLSSSSAAADLD